MKNSIVEENKLKMYKAILNLKNFEECEMFFSDLWTEAEKNTFAQRFVIAEMIHNGKKYEEIGEITGASPAIISRVKRCMRNYEKLNIFDGLEDD